MIKFLVFCFVIHLHVQSSYFKFYSSACVHNYSCRTLLKLSHNRQTDTKANEMAKQKLCLPWSGHAYPVNQHWGAYVPPKYLESAPRTSNLQKVVPCFTDEGVSTQGLTRTSTHYVRHGQLTFASPVTPDTQWCYSWVGRFPFMTVLRNASTSINSCAPINTAG